MACCDPGFTPIRISETDVVSLNCQPGPTGALNTLCCPSLYTDAGRCPLTCTRDFVCGEGEQCVSDGLGGHTCYSAGPCLSAADCTQREVCCQGGSTFCSFPSCPSHAVQLCEFSSECSSRETCEYHKCVAYNGLTDGG
jgi:hypothetical protein